MSRFQSSPRRPSFRPSFESLETRDCPSVAAPTGLSLTALSATQIKVAWNDVTGEAGYRVYRWNGSQAVNVGTVQPNVTSFTVNQLLPNQLNYFTVEAFDASTTGRTAWGSVRTLSDAITAPANLRFVDSSATTITMTWNDSTNESGYRIYTWDGTKPVQVGAVGANVITFQATNLTPGTVNYFYVMAFNATNTAVSDWLTASTKSVTLTAPTNLTTQVIASDKIQLNWNDAVGETGYRVYRWDAVSSTTSLVATLPANTTSYQSTGLQFGTQYWYYVQSFNAASTTNTSWVNATTPANLQLVAPTSFYVSASSSTSALLTWNDAAGAVGYRVYYWTGSYWAILNTVPQGTQQINIGGLQQGRTHWFLLQAFTANSAQIANTAAMFLNL